MKRLTIASLVVAAALAVRSETVAGLEQYGSLTLVDSIECSTKSGHRFSEYPQGRSLSEKRLGADCLTLTHVKTSESGTGNECGAYVSWRLGEGKSLVPKAAYLLVVEYPDDAPRTFTLGNRGTGSRTCVHTGFTIGDALNPPYVTQHPESYNVPLSGQFQRIEQVMYLMEKPESLTDGNTHLIASKDGFDIFFALYPQEDSPDSVGLALKSVKLYKIDNPELLETSPVYPADGLPRRYVTWREEMADEGGYAAFSTPVDYYATKAKLMKVLGFNCASRDLLEFGHCQYWDIWIDEYGWQWIWGVDADKSKYWEDTITAFANEGHTILPYYEYSGARGGTGSLGYQKLCTPLNHDATGNDYFVENTSDASDAMVDITSPDAHDEFKKILNCTILRFKDHAHFRGAWLRNRGSMPVSFHDNTIARFNQETGNNTTRAKIYQAGESSQIYKDYLAWWYGKRAAFLEDMRDYLRQNGVAGAETFFDNDISEPGRIWEGWSNNVAADSEAKYNNKTWQQTVGSIGWSIDSITNTANSWAQYGPMGKYPTYGNYEHHHGCPTEDPATYASRNGVGLALSCGKVYMQIPSATVSSFRNGDDRLFLSHHYSLNEDAMFDANGNNRMLGYFSADTDHAGRASMLPQLWAMAINDPTDYGYLYGAAMESAYAPAMREFNLNFLALPAKKGTVMQGGAWGRYQTVRRYDSASTNIVYWALVNTSTESVTTEFKLSDSTTEFKKVKAVVDGTEYDVTNGKVSLTMKPLQLLSLASEVSAENPPEEPTLQPIPDGAVSVKGFNGGYDGGENHRISVTIAPGYSFNVEYSLSKDGPWSNVNPGRLNVGTSEVWYRVSADGYVPLVGSATVVVTKAGNRWTTEPAIAGWTEGDTPSTPVGRPLFGDTTLVIIYSGTTAKGESVSGASSVSAAGSYTAHFVVPDNTNWEGLSKDVNFTIAAKQVDPPTEPVEQPTNATMQAWFAYTAASEQVVGGAWQTETEDGVKVFLPTASSKDGDLVYVDVKAKFPAVAASRLPSGVSAQGALSAADGYLYVFAADGWTKLANAEVAADTEKSYRVEFDYGSENAPRLRVWEPGATDYTELKDADGTSWFALTANTFKCFTSLSFSGDGTIGDFIGTSETGPREVVTIEIPSFTDADGKVKGGVSLRTVGGKEVFSVTIANGKKGAHYTAFVANTLSADQQDWTAVAASVSPDADGLLTLDIIRDDSPAKFAKIVATPTEVKAGTKLSELAQ